MKNAAYIPETQAKRAEDFRELTDDLLDESERALEDDVAWCAVVHRLLMPVVEREVGAGVASSEAPTAAA